ncbi:hypothetical protein AVEN_167701-1 [Araneus ventricosus]|uniref:Uncharacterized protein n=1 Tax=Araneus ventricosus TaxID=182803 RepID=A0A4Y2MK72_ARAVE|nr:hypothetical protein AVEN_167701-1 [Araneus ventricosus]
MANNDTGSKTEICHWGKLSPSSTNREKLNLRPRLGGQGQRVLVGAPKAQTNQPNVTAGGAVYRCGVESTASCVPVPFDLTGHNPSGISRGQYKDDKSNQWFGATVATSGENGLVVCYSWRFFSALTKAAIPFLISNIADDDGRDNDEVDRGKKEVGRS